MSLGSVQVPVGKAICDAETYLGRKHNDLLCKGQRTHEANTKGCGVNLLEGFEVEVGSGKFE